MKNALILMALSFAITGYSQKIKLIEGDLSSLKGQKGIKTEFKYDDMAVGKFPKEDDYIAKKKSELNGKEAGRGDAWEKSWKADRQERFEPQFRELFSKHSDLSTVDESAPYTLIFKTTKTEPGFNIGVTSRPAFIDGEAWVVESKNPSKVIAKITILKALGRDVMGFDYETGARLQEAYSKAGKELGAFIRSKID